MEKEVIGCLCPAALQWNGSAATPSLPHWTSAWRRADTCAKQEGNGGID